MKKDNSTTKNVNVTIHSPSPQIITLSITTDKHQYSMTL